MSILKNQKSHQTLSEKDKILSKKDQKLAELDNIKTYRNFGITSLLALIAFIFTQYKVIDTWILLISICAILALGIAVCVFQVKISKKIKELGDL